MHVKPNLHHVAQAAGVSLASASRALTGQSASPEMVRRVRSAAKQLGYIPDATARSLRLGGTRQIVFAVDDIGNPNYVAMLRAIETELSPSGSRLSVTSAGRNIDQTVALVRSMSAGVGDGLIISPLRVTPKLRQALLEVSVPTVVIGSMYQDPPIDQVRVDSAAAVGLAAEHLHSLGRRRVAFLNGPVTTNPGRARNRGYTEAVARLNLPQQDRLVVEAEDFTTQAGLAAATALLARRPELGFDAVLAANDLLAIATVSACLASGLRVPEDVAVTGIDDIDIAALYNPAITSVSLQSAQRGALAARLLLARFQDPSRAPTTKWVTPSLTVRASTAIGHAHVN